MTNSRNLERVIPGSAAVSSGSLPDVFRFLLGLQKNCIEWEKGPNQGSDTEQNADAKYPPNLPSVGCLVGPWLQRGVIFQESPGHLPGIF